MSRYLLVPVDDGEEETVHITSGIVCDTPEIKKRVKDKVRLRKLMKELSVHHITESPDGQIMCRNTKCVNVNFNDAVVDFERSDFVDF